MTRIGGTGGVRDLSMKIKVPSADVVHVTKERLSSGSEGRSDSLRGAPCAAGECGAGRR